MNEVAVRKLVCSQAIEFWLGFLIGALRIVLVVTNKRAMDSWLFWLQVIFWVLFVITSGLLAKEIKKRPADWVIVSLFFGPVGAIFTYVILSNAAKKSLAAQKIETCNENMA